MRLTDISVRALKGSESYKTYFDDQLPAFGVRVGKRRKTFVVVRGKQRERTTIGHFPDLSVGEARAKAKKLLASEPEPKAAPKTFKEATDQFLKEHYKDSTSEWPRNVKSILRNHFKGLEHLKLGAIKDEHINDAIDQIEGTRQHDRAHDAPLYTAFVTQFGEPAEPMAIGNDPARPLGNFRVDLSVIHPVQREVGGRPDWLAMGGYRKPHRVALAPLGERSLVRAFVVGEPALAIAMDQILVPADAEAATLMLPAGDYRLVRQTVAGDDLPLGEARIR